ncbi:delta(1)-pyrroline-2-carboxylate reductase family protein [Noviherbaspirillum aerium]|uniref:delta(1)-pyrroline-2-carboxylate reductase family protein n=1 Tax=Noviherbaspirillum aerium TaxID=2588497 RepID=UPI00124EE9F0|nr:delta(1)-pyrroline-2-carboxylate reductase family protein [Noviherbaspirillum aerium]
MKIFDATRTAQALPYAQLVPAVARAARELAAGLIRAPERQVVPIDGDSVLLSMPAIGSDLGVTKLITVHARNGAHGLPAIQGEVIVFDTATGLRRALLHGPTVTARRTAAVTLLGIETLAPRKPASAVIIGSGIQAEAHIEALSDYFGIRDFRVAGRNQERTSEFCKRLSGRLPGISALPIDMAAVLPAAEQAGLVIALTTSRSPVIPADLPPDVLAVGVGAFKPDMAEFPPELLHRRRIVVDDIDGARHEAGDLLQAGIDWNRVTPIAGNLERKDATEGSVPVFKTVGQAAWDLAAARVASILF